MNDDSKTKYTCPAGLLRSWMVTHATFSVLETGRRNQFDRRGVSQPEWLRDLGTGTSLLNFIAAVAGSLETSTILPHARAEKYRKVELRTLSQGNTGTRVQRELAVQKIRGIVLKFLSSGRTSGRAVLFRNVLFLLEKIDSFHTVDEARREGYEIVFREPSDLTELEPSDNIFNGKWNIPETQTGETDDRGGRELNSVQFSKIIQDFPSLTVTLSYKKSVRRSSLESGAPPIPLQDGELYVNMNEKVSLHHVATGIIVDAFRLESWHDLLATSPKALSAVHVFAIALRAMLRSSLKKSITEMETIALGDVTARLLEPGENLASAMLGGRKKDGSVSACTSSKEGNMKEVVRRSKFEMTWTSYSIGMNSSSALGNAGDVLSSERESSSNVIDERSVHIDEAPDLNWMF